MNLFVYYQCTQYGGWAIASAPERPSTKRAEGGKVKIRDIQEVLASDSNKSLSALEKLYPLKDS